MGIYTNKPLQVPQQQADWQQIVTSSASFIKSKPGFAPVAFSGSYLDLSGCPAIPSAQIQSNWSQGTNTSLDFIKNKPTTQASIANASGTCDVNAPTNSPDTSPTNLNIITTLLGTLVGQVNNTNAAQNTIADNLNLVATKYNATATIVNNLELSVNNIMVALRAYGVIST